MSEAYLKIEFLGYWRCGSGASGGGDVDTAALRGPEGLPYVPAKQYKGIIREAAWRLVQAEGTDWSKDIFDILFGSGPLDDKSIPGCLDFRDAKLAPEIYTEVQNNNALLSTLFVRLSSTAVAHDTGVAQTESLRSVEAVVPMTLIGKISWAPEERLSMQLEDPSIIENLANSWPDLLDAACIACLAVGGQRSDGLGRSLLSIVKGEGL